MRDFPTGFEDKVLSAVSYLRRRFKDYWSAMVENTLFEIRCNGVGDLSREDAIRLGATGPVLRGSDVAIDVRKDEPYAAYADLDFQTITEKAGDSMARTKVRLREADESLNMMEQIAKEIPSGPVRNRVSFFTRTTPGEVMTRVETARGELGMHMFTKTGSNPYRVKITSPTLRNMYVFERLAELDDVVVADIPVILYSIDPWYLDADR